MLPHIAKLDDRIRRSDSFFRINEAEKKMKENEDLLHKKYAVKQGKKKKKPNSGHAEIAQKNSDETTPNDFFSCFVLNKDPSAAKYMPYNEVLFPKITDEAAAVMPPDSLQNLWLTGFLDRAERDGKMLAKIEYDKILASMPDEFDRINARLQSPNMSSLDASSSSFAGEGSRSHSANGHHQTNVADEEDDGIFGDNEDYFREAHARQNKLLHAKSSVLSKISVETKSMKKKREHSEKMRKLLPLKFKPYVEAVKEIELAQKKVKLPAVTKFVSSELEKLFELQRIENNAASLIQKAWRWTKLLVPMRHAFFCMRIVVRIQKLIRGYMTRKWVARWFRIKTKIAISWQAHTRKYLSNKHLRPVQQMERDMVVKIQKIVRGKLGRVRFYHLLRSICATKIQTLWRGLVARARSDVKWLDRVVKPIQCMGRRFIAIRKFKESKTEQNLAALCIQRCFRNWAARHTLALRYFEREMQYRMDVITILTAEEEAAESKLLRQGTRVLQGGLQEEAEQLIHDVHEAYENIRRLENDYIEMSRQREIVSPRAIQQGYAQQLDTLLVEMRDQVSDAKLDSIFKREFSMLCFDQQLEMRMKEFEETLTLRDNVSHWKEMEYLERSEFTFHRDIERSRKDRMQAIAHERRKWQVRYYTREGKPDKMRRPGRPWDPSIIAGVEKAVFTGGDGVDLLALDRDGKVLKMGTNESVDRTMSQYNLGVYLEQVRAYEQILEPIQKVMEQFTGAPPGQPGPQDLGFGPIGAELPVAMHGIGALPVAWRDKPTVAATGPRKKAATAASSSGGPAGRGRGSVSSALVLSADVDGPGGSKSGKISVTRPGSEASTMSMALVPLTAASTTGEDLNNNTGGSEGISSGGSSKQAAEAARRRNGRWAQPAKTLLTRRHERLGESFDTDMAAERYARVAALRRQMAAARGDTDNISTYGYGNRGDGGSAGGDDNGSMDSLLALEAVEAAKAAAAEAAAKALAAAEESARQERRRQRKKERRRAPAVIPWSLLDELDGQKRAFENEKNYFEFTAKF